MSKQLQCVLINKNQLILKIKNIFTNLYKLHTYYYTVEIL